jgi:hypothetical protein
VPQSACLTPKGAGEIAFAAIEIIENITGLIALKNGFKKLML